MKKNIKSNIGLLVKIIIGIFMIMPVIMAILFSFQSNLEINSVPLNLFTKNPTLENYKYVIENIPIFTYLKNTVVMLIICIPCQVILGSLAAYGFSFFDFPFKNALFTVFLAVMMIPGEVIIISNYTTVQNMGLMDTYMGMTITSLFNVSAMFMLRQHMLSMPKALHEAAKIDGCGDMKYLFSVVLPMSKSIIAAQVLNSFISIYNAYFWPLLVTQTDEMRTVQTGVAQLMLSGSNYYGWVLAGAVLSMIIPIIVYVLGLDKIVDGMTAGAVKS